MAVTPLALRSSSSPLLRLAPVVALLLSALAAGAPARADALSAAAAEAALAGGALAWDVRAPQPGAGGLPGARQIDPQALRRWLRDGDLAALQDAVSRAGLDLSRELLVYGDAGDPRAQALVDSLQGLSRAHVHWLVGGATEWAMSGRALRPLAAGHAPVPQRLVLQQAHPGQGQSPGRMAAAALRGDAAEAAEGAGSGTGSLAPGALAALR
ncbi:MAG: rhodanese-like domain-containing protein [Burkholderiaceae bacterium]